LDDFDVAVCGIPVTMRVCDNKTLASLAVLEETNHGDVVARHDTIEDVVLGFHVRTVDGDVGVVNVSFVKENVPVRPVISACASTQVYKPTYLLFLKNVAHPSTKLDSLCVHFARDLGQNTPL